MIIVETLFLIGMGVSFLSMLAMLVISVIECVTENQLGENYFKAYEWLEVVSFSSFMSSVALMLLTYAVYLICSLF